MPLARGTRGGRIAQGVFLGALAGYLLLLAVELPELSRGARLFPAIILLACGLFMALKILSTFSTRAARFLEPDVGPMISPASEVTDSADRPAPGAAPRATSRAPSAIVAWLWVAGVVAAMYAVGFLAGIGVSVLAYMRLVGGDGWRQSAAVTGITVLFAYLVFVRAMHIPLDLGLMSEFMRLE